MCDLREFTPELEELSNEECDEQSYNKGRSLGMVAIMTDAGLEEGQDIRVLQKQELQEEITQRGENFQNIYGTTPRSDAGKMELYSKLMDSGVKIVYVRRVGPNLLTHHVKRVEQLVKMTQ